MSDAGTPSSLQEMQQLLDRSPFVAFLGLKMVAANPQRDEITMLTAMRPEFERSPNSNQWHGGPIAAIIDTVGDYALVMSLRRAVPTINFRIDYLRPAVNTSLQATARVRRSGRTVGVVDVDVIDEQQRLVAIGRATYSTAPVRERHAPGSQE
ncbi:PaaI family thioesterase [soil metagenome]